MMRSVHILLAHFLLLVCSILSVAACSDCRAGPPVTDTITTTVPPKDPRFWPILGSGYFGLVYRSNYLTVAGVYVKGTFKDDGGKVFIVKSRRAIIPAPPSISVATLVEDGSTWQLDMSRGVFTHTTACAPEVSCSVTYYAHRERRNIFVATIQATRTSTDGFGDPVSIPITYNATLPRDNDDMSWSRRTPCPAPASDCSVQTGTTRRPEEGSPAIEIALVFDNAPSNLTIPAGEQTVSVTVLTAIATSLPEETETQRRQGSTRDRHRGGTHVRVVSRGASRDRHDTVAMDPATRALEGYLSARNASSSLLTEHVGGWQREWRGGIEISGNTNIALEVNTTLYTLISSMRTDWDYPATPSSYTNGYYGNVFFDDDVFQAMALLPFNRNLSRNVVRYHSRRIPAAKQNAAEHGRTGLKFAWQSAATGRPVDFIAEDNEREIHNNADIANVLRYHWYASTDKDWFESTAWPMVQGICDYFASRATKQADGSWSLEGVQPIDEYAIGVVPLTGVTDSVYLNAVVRSIMSFACKWATEPVNPVWKELATNLRIEYDSAKQFHPEYAGFPAGNWLYGGKVKQADVVMLEFPAGLNHSSVTPRILENDLNYYGKITDSKGPVTLTYASTCIAWMFAGNQTNAESAYDASRKSMQGPFYSWSETPNPNVHPSDMGATHYISNGGAYLQQLIYGFGGVRWTSTGVTLDPKLLSSTTEIKFRGFHFANTILDISWNNANTTLVVVEGPSLELKPGPSANSSIPLAPGSPVTVPNGVLQITNT